MSESLSERALILLRAGQYAGLADRLLGDKSYWMRAISRAHEIPSEQFERESREIHDRLVAAGHLRADEDPMEGLLKLGDERG